MRSKRLEPALEQQGGPMFKLTNGEGAAPRLISGRLPTVLRLGPTVQGLFAHPIAQGVLQRSGTARPRGYCWPSAIDSVVKSPRRAYGLPGRPLATRLERNIGLRANAMLGVAVRDRDLAQHSCVDFYQPQVRTPAAQRRPPICTAILQRGTKPRLPGTTVKTAECNRFPATPGAARATLPATKDLQLART